MSSSFTLRPRPLTLVASVYFDPKAERILDVTRTSTSDPVHRRYSVLGDDSILLKYLSPSLTLVISESVASPPIMSSSTAAAAAATTDKANEVCTPESGADSCQATNLTSLVVEETKPVLGTSSLASFSLVNVLL